jgi:hypothetical protein
MSQYSDFFGVSSGGSGESVPINGLLPLAVTGLNMYNGAYATTAPYNSTTGLYVDPNGATYIKGGKSLTELGSANSNPLLQQYPNAMYTQVVTPFSAFNEQDLSIAATSPFAIGSGEQILNIENTTLIGWNGTTYEEFNLGTQTSTGRDTGSPWQWAVYGGPQRFNSPATANELQFTQYFGGGSRITPVTLGTPGPGVTPSTPFTTLTGTGASVQMGRTGWATPSYLWSSQSYGGTSLFRFNRSTGAGDGTTTGWITSARGNKRTTGNTTSLYVGGGTWYPTVSQTTLGTGYTLSVPNPVYYTTGPNTESDYYQFNTTDQNLEGVGDQYEISMGWSGGNPNELPILALQGNGAAEGNLYGPGWDYFYFMRLK